MTREDIIRMAREAGFCIESIDGDNEVMEGDRYHIQTDVVARFAALVAAAEREACAKVCENYTDNGGENFEDYEGHGYDIAKAIRARSKP